MTTLRNSRNATWTIVSRPLAAARAIGAALAFSAAQLAAATAGPAAAADDSSAATAPRGFVSPDVFVLGDSQITFGAGPVLLDFFQNINARCAAAGRPGRAIAPDDGSLRVGVLGVRSTAIHSWVARRGRAKAMVCEKDKTWGVNAGAFGQLSETGKKWEQIGEDPHNQFCEKGRSPFEKMFAGGYYSPKLFVMFFLGNASARWGQSTGAAVKDVKALAKQLPKDARCLMVTTAPSYTKKSNRRRLKAQTAIIDAFEQTGRRCAVVPGITPETTAALQGDARFYRRRKDGSVKDPFHPNRAGARAWLAKTAPALCAAVAAQWPMPAPALASFSAPRRPLGPGSP